MSFINNINKIVCKKFILNQNLNKEIQVTLPSFLNKQFVTVIFFIILVKTLRFLFSNNVNKKVKKYNKNKIKNLVWDIDGSSCKLVF